jgi:lipid-binding SYLF domain-containing protein
MPPFPKIFRKRIMAFAHQNRGSSPRRGWQRLLAALLVLAAGLLPVGPGALAETEAKAQAAQLSPAEQAAEREARLKIGTEGLDKLYAKHPEARKAVEAAAGYAVFDISAIYAVLFVGQKGKGVLFDNTTKQPTYMSSARAGTGPGVGKQRFYQVFVFKNKGSMEQFMLAGGLGGDVNATASAGKDGIVRSFNPSIDIYQINLEGFAVQASWGGTVYSVDSTL